MSLTEGISGVRAKKFFSETLYDLFQKMSKLVPNWEEQVDALVSKNYRKNMDSSSQKPKPHNINSFLRWLGFSPVEFNWNEEMKIGRLYFSGNVLWQKNPDEDRIVKQVIKSLTKAIGESFIGNEPHLVLIDEKKLPPRYKMGIRFLDKAEAITTKIDETIETSKLTLGKHIFDPIISPKIDENFISQAFLDASIEIVKKNYPTEWQNVKEELLEVPSKIFLFLYKKASIDSAIKDIGNQVGTEINKRLKEEYPDAKPHQLIKGIGLMPIDDIDELMSYGSPKLCNYSENLDFCVFMTHIWSVIISKTLGKVFEPEKPLCAAKRSQYCIYTFKSIE